MNNERINHIIKVFKKLKKSGEKLNVDNLITQSLFIAGGTISKDEAEQFFSHYVNVGFCQKKFYTFQAWSIATDLMTELISAGLAYPYDYGRGKGKYETDKTIQDCKNYFIYSV